jgi:hypothetical protein
MKKFFAAFLLVSFCVVVIAQSGTQHLGDRLFVNSSSHPSPSVIIGPQYAPWLAISSSGFTGTLASSIGGASFPMLAPDGTASAPSYSFSNLTGGGLYLSGTSITLSGASTTGATSGRNLLLNGGNAGDTGGGGGITIAAGSGGTVSGNGGTTTLNGGGATEGNGGSVNLNARDAVGTNKNGGVINITSGLATGSGTPGLVSFLGSGITKFKAITFASLPTPTDGMFLYCSDCTIASPCAGSGTGAFAKRLNGVWVCN